MKHDILTLFPEYIRECDYIKALVKKVRTDLLGYGDSVADLFEEAYITRDVRRIWGDFVLSPLFDLSYQSHLILRKFFKPCTVTRVEDFKEYIYGWIAEDSCSVEYDADAMKVTIKTTEDASFVKKNYQFLRDMTPCNMALEFLSVESL